MAKTPENPPENVNPTTGEITQPDAARPASRFRSWVQQQANDDGDTWEVTSRQLDKILTAEDFDAIMDADEAGTRQGRDLVGFEFTVPQQKFRYAKSADRFEAPLGVYMQFTCIALADYKAESITVGEEVLVSTGAPLIVGKLRTLQANGFLPASLTITGIITDRGTVLKLRKAPNRAVPSTTA